MFLSSPISDFTVSLEAMIGFTLATAWLIADLITRYPTRKHPPHERMPRKAKVPHPMRIHFSALDFLGGGGGGAAIGAGGEPAIGRGAGARGGIILFLPPF